MSLKSVTGAVAALAFGLGALPALSAPGTVATPPPRDAADSVRALARLEDRARAVVNPLVAKEFKDCAKAMPELARVVRDPLFESLESYVRRPTLAAAIICGDMDGHDPALGRFAAGRLDEIADTASDRGLSSFSLMLDDLKADRTLAAARRLVIILDNTPVMVSDWKPAYLAPLVWAADGDRPLQMALLSGLVAANWTRSDTRELATNGWALKLARMQAEQNNFIAVRTTLKPVTGLSQTIAIAQDRRFEPVWDEMQTAGRFDWTAAAEAQLGRRRRAMSENPRSLYAVQDVINSLRVLGRFDEAVAVGQAARAGLKTAKPPFDDIPDAANWMLNELGYALLDTGQVAEAETVFAESITAGKKDGDNVSQTINWAGMLNRLGRHQEALTLLQAMDPGQASPYGRRWRDAEQVCALSHLNPDAAGQGVIETLVNDMQKNWRENAAAAMAALLCLDRQDEAAALMVKRLESPDERGKALTATLKSRPFPNPSKFDAELEQRQERVLARPEVVKAIEAVGRRIDLPLWGDYWGAE